MENNELFIEQIASYVCKYAPIYGIKVCSAIIGQACLESAYGTSSKAKHCNYFGLKYRKDRCPTSDGTFTDGSVEQRPGGSYVSITDTWFSFPTMEAGVQGYFDFINIPNYSNVKGIIDPRQYLTLLKEDKYATSINYVDKVMKVITDNNLTRFDSEGGNKMVFNIHAGHNPDGKTACGAIGLIKESTEARNVKNEVIRQLQLMGHTVYDCTVDNGVSQADVLTKIVTKCNAHTVDLDVSIHFNSGAKDLSGNGKTTGTEVYIYNSSSAVAKKYAQQTVDAIAKIGYKNRGVKTNSSLYVLRNTKAQAMLIECCFVDDADDVRLYDAASMASAIVYGLTGQKYEEPKTDTIDDTANNSGAETATGNADTIYRVQVGAFKNLANAEKLKTELQEMGVKAFITKA